MAIHRYEVTDSEWERIREYIPTAKTGRPPKDHRQMLNAMLWMARSGAMWEDLPARKCNWWLYKERHLVECFFNKLKHFRRVATRYDKLAKSFFAFVLLASIMILVK